ncbi:spc97 / spc98 family protein [Sarocladium implicatum]|nr:spc97 / spc98 family protein [Sarocladium implicatum]
MLHEILLSLSGHPSPLLHADISPEADAVAGITPPERHLLAEAARLSEIHIKVTTHAAQIANTHKSTVCRAVASSIESTQLAAFQRKVLDVESGILQDDPALVGAYNIVPLTAVIGEFRPWVRRMEWLWGIVRFMSDVDGATLINRLRDELQSGYRDIEETAMSLVQAAESSWLQQVSVWILNGQLPMYGSHDFFVQKVEEPHAMGADDFTLESSLLPSFVTPGTASSMLFIGKSLNRARLEKSRHVTIYGMEDMPQKIKMLASLSLPLKSSDLTGTIISLRRSLAEKTLQKLLPLAKVIEALQLLRDFFLLGRGEFAMALVDEADERTRNRWRRADNLGYEKAEGVSNITVKNGEVAATLARTWGVLVSRQGHYDDEDDQVEMARGLLHLQLDNPKLPKTLALGPGLVREDIKLLLDLPFSTLLFSSSASLSIDLPSPLDMILSHSDLNIYSIVNSYLLSLRRAHARLTDLWKITSLRRHYPAPSGADEQAVALRQRWSERLSLMRSSWTTASAAVFFLAETEAFLQTEIVAVLWDDFYSWMTGHQGENGGMQKPSNHSHKSDKPETVSVSDGEDDDDIWLGSNGVDETDTSRPARDSTAGQPFHDPQTLSTAHMRYLHTLIHRLLLTQPTFTQPLHTLLVHIDYLVSHVRRLHSIFTALDLEEDAGVVDAFVDLEREEREVQAQLREVETKVKRGIEEVVAALRALEADVGFMAEWEGESAREVTAAEQMEEEGARYLPPRVGGINRLLMKLDFGSWF